MTPDLTHELREEIIAAIVCAACQLQERGGFPLYLVPEVYAEVTVYVNAVPYKDPDNGRSIEHHRRAVITKLEIFVDELPVEVTPEVRAQIQAAVNEQL